jgi:hypothetical protein
VGKAGGVTFDYANAGATVAAARDLFNFAVIKTR